MRRHVKLCGCLPLVLSVLALMCAAEDEAGFERLFDGQTFAGWEGNLSIFRIEDGAIVGGNLKTPIKQNEFLCTTRDFADFELRLQAKLVGPGNNAGIQLRSRRIPNHHEVIGYQCDMGDAENFGGGIWGAIYDESRRRRMLAQSSQEVQQKALRREEWNDFVIRCEGPRIQVWLNGYLTVDYTETEDVATSGMIGLQIHSGAPAEASYRNIRIKVLQ